MNININKYKKLKLFKKLNISNIINKRAKEWKIFNK
jgi:hypothetical protein